MNPNPPVPPAPPGGGILAGYVLDFKFIQKLKGSNQLGQIINICFVEKVRSAKLGSKDKKWKLKKNQYFP